MYLFVTILVYLFVTILKAAVLEDALDGVQDNPMLSTGTSRTSPGPGEAGGAPGDGGNDGSVQRLESLRELLDAALYYRPDLPLQLCVKSEYVYTLYNGGYHTPGDNIVGSKKLITRCGIYTPGV